ncbi:DNA-binding response regulator [Sulfurimonas sp.]|uniref:response regulator transcription factor n=1 Tax=Sulfurimonas sp. TaxID=2022749 RepID=UPI002B45FECA|nr:DNA-binding response regulator [Sulfurimonas sp.]
MSKIKIIIVEDEPIIALNLKESLEDLNYNVCGIASNKCKLMKIIDKKIIPDIILMDINLKSKFNGIEIAKEFKISHPFVPIIFLTANSNISIIEDVTDTVSYGYIIKPYKLHNLQASIELSIKKIKKLKNSEDIKKVELFSPYVYDKEKRILLENNKEIKLTKNETLLIEILCKNKYVYISQEFIENTIWENHPAGMNAFRSLIFRLRNKIDEDLIINQKGFGYKIRLD